MRKINFGVNYIPSKSWYFQWAEDLDSIKDDFWAIRAIGLEHLRIQLRWDLFQPEPYKLNSVYMKRLEKVLDIAKDTGLEIEVSALTGWLSGFWFLPSFAQKGNIICNGDIIKSELFFLKQLSAFCCHPAFYGLDIGNEINMYAYKDMPNSIFNMEEGNKWLRTIALGCNEYYQNKSVTIGCDHQPWLEDKFFSRRNLASFGTSTALHTWIEFTGATKYHRGAFSNQSLHLGEICSKIADAYSSDFDRNINIQEFGISDLWLEKDQNIEDFILTFIKNTLKCSQTNRITFWCSHDIDQKYNEFNELEYGLGLFNNKNELKPVGRAYKKAISLYKNITKEHSETTAILINDSYKKSDKDFGWYFGEKFCALKEKGKDSICFITEDNINNFEYLRTRHITKLIYPEEVL